MSDITKILNKFEGIEEKKEVIKSQVDAKYYTGVFDDKIKAKEEAEDLAKREAAKAELAAKNREKVQALKKQREAAQSNDPQVLKEVIIQKEAEIKKLLGKLAEMNQRIERVELALKAK